MRGEVTPQVAAALRHSHTQDARVEVWRGGARLDTGLPGGELTVLDGEVRIDGTAKVRRQITIQVPNTDQIWDLLSVPGTELRPYFGLQFPDPPPGTALPVGRFGVDPFGMSPFGGPETGIPATDPAGHLGLDPLGSAPLGGEPGQPAETTGPIVAGGTVWVPLGRMEVDQPHIDYSPEGNLQVTGGDYYAKVQASNFLLPATAEFGTLIVNQIILFLQQALPGVPIINQVTATWVIGSKVYTDRAAAIEEMLTAIGIELVFDANGNAVLRPVPTVSGTAVWMVDAGQTGVLLGADRQGTLANTRNVVVVSSSTVDGSPSWDPVIVWDDDPTSPTYAGPDPVNNPGAAGPFGVRPHPVSSTAIYDRDQARTVGLAQLAQRTGRSSQLNLTAAVNPGLEPGDTIAVQLPPDPIGGRRPVEAHLVDIVTIPLTPEGDQTITTRTRGPVA